MEELLNVSGDMGSVKISDDVVGTIAGLAAAEVAGIANMSGGLTGLAGGIAEALGRKNLSKGIKVEVNGNDAVIDVHIIVEYGFRIPDVAWQVQEKIKKAVESMTGLVVTAVNVHIQGVNIERDRDKDKDKDKDKD